MATPQVKWTTPAPMWPTVPSNGNNGQSIYRQPAILRFANDDFMDEFMNTVAVDPNRLSEWEALPETWRGPATSPIPVKTLPTFAQRVHRLRLSLEAVSEGNAPPKDIPEGAMIPAGNLKLYQPAHQRYYLVTAGLVCALPGLPDRLLNFNQGEKTSFVIRRLQSDEPGQVPTLDNLSDFDEYAFCISSQGNYWQRMGQVNSNTAQIIADGEERQPLFGVTYGENGRSRRVLAGMVPVGKREDFVGAPMTTNGNGALDVANNLPDPRAIDFEATVIQPWESIINLDSNILERYGDRDDLEDDLDDADVSASDKVAALTDYDVVQDEIDYQIQGTSWYILLDFADYLQKYFSADFWTNLSAGTSIALSDGEATLLTELKSLSVGSQTLAEALGSIVNHRTQLEDAITPYAGETTGWPPAFSLVDAGLLASMVIGEEPLGHLITWIDAALADNDIPAQTPALPLATRQTAVDQSQPAWYIMRCVFERPQCADQEAFSFSEPTEPFQIASFFDPDAPARPIRISMPLDTSPAGLRKFNKNTAFVLSDILACQMERAGGLSLGDLVLSVLPWPFHKNLPDPGDGSCSKNPDISIGMICTLSIPIITICALILLMIIVTLLDTIFRWLPYFIMCFPLPSLKGKD